MGFHDSSTAVLSFWVPPHSSIPPVSACFLASFARLGEGESFVGPESSVGFVRSTPPKDKEDEEGVCILRPAGGKTCVPQVKEGTILQVWCVTVCVSSLFWISHPNYWIGGSQETGELIKPSSPSRFTCKTMKCKIYHALSVTKHLEQLMNLF